MSEIQALGFPKDTFKKKDVVDFLYRHQMKPLKKIREEGHYYRVRLTDPRPYKKYITKISPDNIHFIIGFY